VDGDQRDRVDSFRVEFFENTRRMMMLMYIGVGAAGLAAAVYALTLAVIPAVGGLLLGILGTTALWWLSIRGARVRGASAWIVIGVAFVFVFEALPTWWQAAIAGLSGGVLLASIACIAGLRRRLATDDAMVEAAIARGANPNARARDWFPT
jgi:uncharacterized membrane protein YccC